MENYWIEEEKHKIRVNEVGKDNYATFPAILNLMQEVAWNNSQKLNFSVYEMQERGFTWVVHRMQFHISEYPKHYDEVYVRSWPSGRDRLYTYRDYEIVDSQSKQLVRGTSAWIVFDINKRKPVAIPDFFKALEFPKGVQQLEIGKDKINVPSDSLSQYEVHYHHIDLNNHTNNAQYVNWLMEDCCKLRNSLSRPKHFDIVFKGETNQGDLLESFGSLQGKDTSIHMLRKKADHSVVVQAKISF